MRMLACESLAKGVNCEAAFGPVAISIMTTRVTETVVDREQFQQKCAAVLRPELRKNKELERVRVSVKNGNAPPTGEEQAGLSYQCDHEIRM